MITRKRLGSCDDNQEEIGVGEDSGVVFFFCLFFFSPVS